MNKNRLNLKTILIATTFFGALSAYSLSAVAQADAQFKGISEVELPAEDDVPPPGQSNLSEATPEVSEKPVSHSGLYYDADSFAPNSSLGPQTAPREVDPRYEPGSRFVVVRKNAGAGSYTAQLISAQRALDLGRYTAALEMYETLYQKNPNKIPVLMGLAVAQQEGGFTESAITTYEEILKKDPNNADALVNMLGLVGSQYPSVAFRKLTSLWEKNSRNPGVAAQLGLTSAELGNTDDAIHYLGIAASMQPDNANHIYNMAVISDRAGHSRQAIDFYQKALELDISHGAGRSIPREQVYDRLANLRRL